MRSSCLRLSTPRTKGPKSIKLTEFASQLNKYEINPCEKWTDLVLDLINFTQTTLELLECDENPIKSLFGLPGGQCQNCRELTKPINEFIFEVNSSEFVEKDQIVNLEDIINNLIKVKLVKGCPECKNSFQFRGTDEMFLIIKLSHAINVKILNSEDIKGKRLFYKSHYQEGIKEDQICMSSFFNCDSKLVYQNLTADICESKFGIHRNVKLLSVFCTNINSDQNYKESKNFVYGSKELLKLNKKYLSVMNPEQHSEKQIMQKEYEMERNADSIRKAYKDKFDKKKGQD